MSSEQFETDEQKVSYGVGRQMGLQLASQSFEGIVPDVVAQGVIDALNGTEAKLSEADIEKAYHSYEEKMQAKAAEQGKHLATEGESFLKENGARDEVTVLESGLQYEVIQEGSGDKPQASSTVKTHYHGTLINGDVFDSSVSRGQPAEFPVNGVIAGWTEALQMMPVGTKWRLFVPPHLAYGERGAGGKIGPNATLIFEVELLDIVS
ncbi:MAG: FKBP-type peptidyl-prolyl cis-trans isomerase [Agarilytica sp.]